MNEESKSTLTAKQQLFVDDYLIESSRDLKRTAFLRRPMTVEPSPQGMS